MEAVSAAASILAMAEATLKIGGILFDKIKAYKNAQKEVLEYWVQYRGSWLQVEAEIEILKCIVDALDKDLLGHLDDQLTILERKLTVSVSRLDRVTKINGYVASKTYALFLKEPLKRAVNELEQWAVRFKPSWFSTARSLKASLSQYVPQGQLVESSASRSLEALRRVVQGSQDDSADRTIFLQRVALLRQRSLPYTSAVVTSDPNDASLDVIADGVHATESFVLDARDIESLARKLRLVEEPILWGLLQCRGILSIQEDAQPSATSKSLYLFSVPSGLSRPRSLRDLLQNENLYSLNERVELAKTLARSVLFVHNLKFVHKNIRPETILTFSADSDPDQPRKTFLTGFESFRYADGPTHQSQKQQWERDLYRHPSRQGINPQVRYAMQHDMYSLGVCLLEIGLWSSFVHYSTKDGCEEAMPAWPIDVGDLMKQKHQTRRAHDIKVTLCDLARDSLPASMGARYTNVVRTCLTSWEDNSDITLFGPKADFVSSDGVLEGVRFSERVLLELDEIVV